MHLGLDNKINKEVNIVFFNAIGFAKCSGIPLLPYVLPIWCLKGLTKTMKRVYMMGAQICGHLDATKLDCTKEERA